MKDLRKFISTTIRQLLSENRFEKRDEEQYKSCLMSDLTRMELIQMFFNNIKNINIFLILSTVGVNCTTVGGLSSGCRYSGILPSSMVACSAKSLGIVPPK